MTVGAKQNIDGFFRRWATNFDELCAPYRELLGENGEWVAGPPPIPMTHGGDEAVALLEGFRDGYDLATIDVEVLQLGQVGNVVYSERIDHLVDSTGERFISLPAAGVMDLDDHGRIAYWRDYWDMRESSNCRGGWRADHPVRSRPSATRAMLHS